MGHREKIHHRSKQVVVDDTVYPAKRLAYVVIKEEEDNYEIYNQYDYKSTFLSGNYGDEAA